MSENSLDFSSLTVTNFEKVTATGTISKAQRRTAGGSVFGELTIDYLDDFEQEQSVTASIYEGKEGQPMGNIAIRQYKELAAATGTTNFDQLVGARVKFTAVPQTGAKGDPSKPNFSKFESPAE